MESKARADVPAILAAYDFAQFATIGDIGGGRGHLISAILEAAPRVGRGAIYNPFGADRHDGYALPTEASRDGRPHCLPSWAPHHRPPSNDSS